MSVIKRYNISEANTLTKPLNLQDITVDPSTETQTVTYNSELAYNGLNTVTINPITSALDANLSPENIRVGKTIFNVEGTFEGGGAALNRFLGRTATSFSEEDLDGVQSIASYAFYSYSNLKEIHIPASVQNVQSYAFQNCGLKDVYINAKSFDLQAFSGCSITNFVLGENVESISNITSSYGGIGGNQYGISTYLGTESNPYKFLKTTRGGDINDNCKKIFGSGLSSNTGDIYIPKEVNVENYITNNFPTSRTIYTDATEKPANWGNAWNNNKRNVVWGAKKKKYNISVDDTIVESITRCVLDTHPSYEKEGYYYWDLYSSNVFEEENVITLPYYSENETTLYARFETEEKPDGITPYRAKILRVGDTPFDTNKTDKAYCWGIFTPQESGKYGFRFSIENEDMCYSIRLAENVYADYDKAIANPNVSINWYSPSDRIINQDGTTSLITANLTAGTSYMLTYSSWGNYSSSWNNRFNGSIAQDTVLTITQQ